MKDKALGYINMMIDTLTNAVKKEDACPEWKDTLKELGRMYLYLRDLVERHGE